MCECVVQLKIIRWHDANRNTAFIVANLDQNEMGTRRWNCWCVATVFVRIADWEIDFDAQIGIDTNISKSFALLQWHIVKNWLTIATLIKRILHLVRHYNWIDLRMLHAYHELKTKKSHTIALFTTWNFVEVIVPFFFFLFVSCGKWTF